MEFKKRWKNNAREITLGFLYKSILSLNTPGSHACKTIILILGPFTLFQPHFKDSPHSLPFPTRGFSHFDMISVICMGCMMSLSMLLLFFLSFQSKLVSNEWKTLIYVEHFLEHRNKNKKQKRRIEKNTRACDETESLPKSTEEERRRNRERTRAKEGERVNWNCHYEHCQLCVIAHSLKSKSIRFIGGTKLYILLIISHFVAYPDVLRSVCRQRWNRISWAQHKEEYRFSRFVSFHSNFATHLFLPFVRSFIRIFQRYVM